MICIGTDRVRKSTVQKLRREWELLTLRDGESDFALRLSGLMSLLTIHDDPVDKLRAVEKLPRVIPRKYSQIALSIETLLDTTELLIEEVTGQLTADDNCCELPESEQPLLSGGKLYSSEEQWLAWMKQRREGEGSSMLPKMNSGRRRLHGARKKTSSAPTANEGDEDDDRDKCHSCGRLGHWAKDCHKPRKAQTHLT